ncbi:MAG: AI-2E family transporter [Planctomycetota bacterium]|jgi:predicted PurR-regulated permease PerM
MATKIQQKQAEHQFGGLPAPSRFLITIAAFVVVVAGMRAAVQIIVPFLMSVFLAIIATPALFWLKKKGIGTGFAILLVSLIILMVGLLVGTILTSSITDFTKDLPQYATKLEKDLNGLEQKWNAWLDKIQKEFHKDDDKEKETAKDEELAEQLNTELSESKQIPETVPIEIPPAESVQQADPEQDETPPSFSISQVFDTGKAIQMMRDLLSQLGSIVTNGFMIYLIMVFILLEASILPGKIKATMQNNPETFENLSTIADDMKQYLAMKTLLSLATGVLIAVWLIILDVKYPIVWGLIAFLLNFVPNIGSIIAAIPACLLALVQLGPTTAGMAALGYLVVNVVIGNLIEPRLMGQRLGLSTLVVFLSLIFWGWILGPIGMLLSVPLTMTLKIALQSHPDTRNLAILLSSQSPPTPRKKKSES